MRLQRWRLGAARVLGVAAIALVGAGCGQDSPTDSFSGFSGDVPEMSIDLAAPDGGLSAAAEKPYFGDPFFSTYLGERGDIEITGDPLAADPRMTELQERPDVKVMFLRVLWGNLESGPEVSELLDGTRMDWTGGARVTEGVLLPLRTLAFERGDYLIPPWAQDDPSRQKVAWVSHTGPAKDGVLLAIVVPAAGDTELSAAGLIPRGDGLTEDDLFIFRTGPLQIAFPLAGIADLDSTVMVDGQNGVSFLGFDRSDLSDLCPRGTLEGAWVRVESDEFLGGFFRARWVGPLGNVIGHVRGRWGVLPEGEKVFVGKIIRRDGSFLGRVRGTWEPSADSPTHGWFHGAWVVPGRADGRLRGSWAVSERFDRGGFLRGIWAAACNREDAAS